MFDEPDERSAEIASDPALRAREKTEELALHAELAAVFEGPRKFDAQLDTGFDPQLARDIQRRIGRLVKAKSSETGPLLPATSYSEAADLLGLARPRGLSTGDYHVHRRPGEVMIVRWLEAEEVETFYERFEAHFDVALNGYRDEERSANEWKQDPATLAYLAALDKVELRMADRYLRNALRKHNIFVLSTLAVDEMDILHLCDYVMGVSAAEVVGVRDAPPAEPTEADRAWFFKLFSLRGMDQGVERMCFFAYLQKSSDGLGDW